LRTAVLEAALREREVLLREVHHRVKNNLSIVVSLLEMQARSLGPSAASNALDDCRGRVQAMASIHESLYRSTDVGQVPFADYIRGLVREIVAASASPAGRISLVLAIDDLTLAIDLAIPCALILNELVTNAFKHAFPEGRPGALSVTLARGEGGLVHLSVADDGVGLTHSPELPAQDTLGMRLVTTLTEQLEGTLSTTTRTNGGTRFELTFRGGAS